MKISNDSNFLQKASGNIGGSHAADAFYGYYQTLGSVNALDFAFQSLEAAVCHPHLLALLPVEGIGSVILQSFLVA